jgi:hypothetical protein
MTKPAPTDDFLILLEKGVRDVIADKKATPADRLKAIEAGAKLLGIKHKISGSADGDSYFK